MICKLEINMKKTYNTKPKEYILDFLYLNKDRRFSVNEIYEYIKSKDQNINITTIYRNLNTLQKEGNLLKHQSGTDNYATYQFIENTNCLAHFHFECKKCGKVIHLGAKETNDFLKIVKDKLFFTVEPQNTYITGLCINCKGKFLDI